MTTSLNELEYITELKVMGHYCLLSAPVHIEWCVYTYKKYTVWLPFRLSRNGQNTILFLGLYCARTLFDLVCLHLSSIWGHVREGLGQKVQSGLSDVIDDVAV
jgi:hypothetical protein